MLNIDQFKANNNLYSAGYESLTKSITHAKGNKFTLDNISNWYIFEDQMVMSFSLLRKYEQVIRNLAIELKIDKDYFYKPEYVSFALYGTTDLWYLLLFLNNMKNVDEFNKEVIKVISPEKVDIFNRLIGEEYKRLYKREKPKPISKHILKHPNLPSKDILPDYLDEEIDRPGLKEYEENLDFSKWNWDVSASDYYHKGKTRMVIRDGKENMFKEKRFMDGIVLDNSTNNSLLMGDNSGDSFSHDGFMYFKDKGEYEFEFQSLNGECSLMIDGEYVKDDKDNHLFISPSITKEFDYFEKKTLNSDFKRRNLQGWGKKHSNGSIYGIDKRGKLEMDRLLKKPTFNIRYQDTDTIGEILTGELYANEVHPSLEPLNDRMGSNIIFDSKVRTFNLLNMGFSPYVRIHYASMLNDDLVKVTVDLKQGYDKKREANNEFYENKVFGYNMTTGDLYDGDIKIDTTEHRYPNEKWNINMISDDNPDIFTAFIGDALELNDQQEWTSLRVVAPRNPRRTLVKVEFGFSGDTLNKKEKANGIINIDSVGLFLVKYPIGKITINEKNKWLPFRSNYKHNGNSTVDYRLLWKVPGSSIMDFIDNKRTAFIPLNSETIYNEGVLIKLKSNNNTDIEYIHSNMEDIISVESSNTKIIFDTMVSINSNIHDYKLTLPASYKTLVTANGVEMMKGTGKEFTSNLPINILNNINNDIESEGHSLVRIRIEIEGVKSGEFKISFKRNPNMYFENLFGSIPSNLCNVKPESQLPISSRTNNTRNIEMLDNFKNSYLKFNDKEQINTDDWIMTYDMLFNARDNGAFIFELDKQENGDCYMLVFKYSNSSDESIKLEHGLYKHNRNYPDILLSDIDPGIDFYKTQVIKLLPYKTIDVNDKLHFDNLVVNKGTKHSVKIRKKKNRIIIDINGKQVAVYFDNESNGELSNANYMKGYINLVYFNMDSVKIENMALYN